jgi:hypothetical protein
MKSTRTQTAQIAYLLAIIANDAYDLRMREIERKYAHVPPYEPPFPKREVFVSAQDYERAERANPAQPSWPFSDPQPEWALFGDGFALCGNLPEKRKKRYTNDDYARNPYVGFRSSAQVWLTVLQKQCLRKTPATIAKTYKMQTGRDIKRDLRRLEQRGSIWVSWAILCWGPKFANNANNL